VSGNANDERITSSRNSGENEGSPASFSARTLFKMAPQTNRQIRRSEGFILARPKAPPIVRKKLRAPVTTARSFFGDVACAATRVVWNVNPIPTPSMMRYPMIMEVEMSGWKVVCKPNPTVQIKNPAQMAGLYLPVLDS
jgi:hypothetical protein